MAAIIDEEKLKPDETRHFLENAFRDGTLKTTGTAIDKIMPPVSRFYSGGRAVKKQGRCARFFTALFYFIQPSMPVMASRSSYCCALRPLWQPMMAMIMPKNMLLTNPPVMSPVTANVEMECI